MKRLLLDLPSFTLFPFWLVLVHRPVSAYALFFRDTQAAIKGQNPSASFGEVSKIVASMWDVLAPDHKNVSSIASSKNSLMLCSAFPRMKQLNIMIGFRRKAKAKP